MKPIAVMTIAITVLWAQQDRTAPRNVTALRHWSLDGVTRLAVEVSGPFEYHFDHLHHPERVYYDIQNARLRIEGKRVYTEDLTDKFAQRIRVAETTPGVTRVVIDLNANVDATASVLSSPDRLMIELRHAPVPVTAPITAPIPAPITSAPSAGSYAATNAAIARAARALADSSAATSATTTPSTVFATGTAVAPPPPASHTVTASPAPAVPSPAAPPANPIAESVTPSPAAAKSISAPVETAKPARHTSEGTTSLVRALGLKLQRVVIDPGHGGHDEGTQGPKGLLEKELVLDVALRVGKLVQDRMGAEVIYTRSNDTFIPLEGRTAIANDAKADLFLSIHANSSPVTHVTGVETYYLNFTDSKDALDVASRENASSQKSVFELRDIIQRISAHDKAQESRDFASRIQSALFALSAKTFPDEKNRGVRKAPFVVLIGANMPSVLAEIGFVSNPHEETLLKKTDYRDKLADALFRGISKYAEGLSHFQVAEN